MENSENPVGVETPQSLSLKQCPEPMREHVAAVLAGEYAPPDWVSEYGIATVLDIGANVGSFCLWAKSRWPGCQIDAVEPLPEHRSLIWANAGEDVRLHPFAVADTAGRAPLFLGIHNSGESSLTQLGDQAGHFTMVLTDRVDHWWADFVKIDCEGAEHWCLDQLDLPRCGIVALEWHRDGEVPDLVAQLNAAGLGIVSKRPTALDRGILIAAQPWRIHPQVHSAGRSVKSLPRPKGPRTIFLGLPVYGGYHPHFTRCLMELLTTRPAPVRMLVRDCVGDSLVARARNRLAADFLRSSATHLLFIDTDLIFSAEQIARLASHDVPVVAGLYPKKQRVLDWVCNILPGVPCRSDGLQPVRYAGTGCLMIAREVFESMIRRWPEIAYDPDDGDDPGEKWDFFATGVYVCKDTGRRRYLSEDWFFCQRVLELGYEVLMDTHVVMKHCGDMVFPVDEPQWAEPMTVSPEQNAEVRHGAKDADLE